jgi:hypothetical protein
LASIFSINFLVTSGLSLEGVPKGGSLMSSNISLCLLQILEHEILHAVLTKTADLDVSKELDNIHSSVFVLLTEEKGVFVNEFRIGEWVFPPYLEEPTEDLLN